MNFYTAQSLKIIHILGYLLKLITSRAITKLFGRYSTMLMREVKGAKGVKQRRIIYNSHHRRAICRSLVLCEVRESFIACQQLFESKNNVTQFFRFYHDF
ncbi:hypothetical protein X798_01171 [Onchocerca flexuosa]|uniref:Uncharacterized protein n=2 Tax=Onchocerca flexuosa TaxID=387005 RepID=A0A238C4N4_9BILA|nr:hypothetical protein X798_01171 [Onchocerca flexuosa]